MKLTNENGSKPCITTRYVLYADSPIVYADYDDDGDWQFLSEEPVDESDAVVVSIKQILDHDPSLSGISDLDKGQTAIRDDRNRPWRIAE